MEVLELEQTSANPILNHSTSSESSSIIIKGNIGITSSLLEKVSIENETVLSKNTNDSFGNVRELSMLKFRTVDSKATLKSHVKNKINKSTQDLLCTNNSYLELSSELEDIALENSDPSIMMKSRMSGYDLFKHIHTLNASSLIKPPKKLNDSKFNLLLSLQENSNNHITQKCDSPLNTINGHSKIRNRASKNNSNNSKGKFIDQGSNTYLESTLDITKWHNKSQENSLMESSFKNDKPSLQSNNNIKLYEKLKSYQTDIISNLESKKKNILKNKLKHYESKLFDNVMEHETYSCQNKGKNRLINKAFKNIVFNSTKDKECNSNMFIEERKLITENINIDNPTQGIEHAKSNLIKNNQNKSVTENGVSLHNQDSNHNNENLKELINYFRKFNTLSYEFKQSNLYQYADDFLHESKYIGLHFSNNEKVIQEKNKSQNIEKNRKQHLKFLKNNNLNVLAIETTESQKISNAESTKKNHNLYSNDKFGKYNRFKFNDEGILGKILKTKSISESNNGKIEDVRNFTTSYESEDLSNLDNIAIGDITHTPDRVSARLRKMHTSKPTSMKYKTLPKQITLEEIKKVVDKVTSTLYQYQYAVIMTSKNREVIKNGFNEKKSKTEIENDNNGYRLTKFPKKVKYKNRRKIHVKIKEMRKFLRIKFSSSSQTYTLIDCEHIIEKVNTAINHAQSRRRNISTIIAALQKILYEKNICKNFIEFYTFITNFTPFPFQKKVMPLGGAFGCNGPKIYSKLSHKLKWQ